MNTQDWINKGYNIILDFGPKLIGAIIIWLIGGIIIKFLLKGLESAMKKSNYEASLQKFLIALFAGHLRLY